MCILSPKKTKETKQNPEKKGGDFKNTLATMISREGRGEKKSWGNSIWHRPTVATTIHRAPTTTPATSMVPHADDLGCGPAAALREERGAPMWHFRLVYEPGVTQDNWPHWGARTPSAG